MRSSETPIRFVLRPARGRSASFLVAAALLLPMGCVSKLDEAWHEVGQKKRATDRAYAAVASAYLMAADDMASKKHELQQRHIDRDWSDFKRIHTSSDGRLVSIDERGIQQPLRVADLDAALAARDAKVAALLASKASWKAVHEPFREATAAFVAASESSGETEAKIIEAKRSAQAFLDATIGAVAGIAAGAGVTAAAAP